MHRYTVVCGLLYRREFQAQRTAYTYCLLHLKCFLSDLGLVELHPEYTQNKYVNEIERSREIMMVQGVERKRPQNHQLTRQRIPWLSFSSVSFIKRLRFGADGGGISSSLKRQMKKKELCGPSTTYEHQTWIKYDLLGKRLKRNPESSSFHSFPNPSSF